MRIGILGGTFNPIHYGHLRAAEEVRGKEKLERILFIPSCNPPLKNKDLADARHRFEMTRLSIETNPLFEISDVECRASGKSYTVDTLITLKEMHPDTEFYFILGIDSFLDIPLWHQPKRIMELTNFIVVSRPGFDFSGLSSRIAVPVNVLSELSAGTLERYKTSLDCGTEMILLNVTPINISSTTMRNLLRNGMSIKYLLPEAVESYIISHKLYQEGSDHL